MNTCQIDGSTNGSGPGGIIIGNLDQTIGHNCAPPGPCSAIVTRDCDSSQGVNMATQMNICVTIDGTPVNNSHLGTLIDMGGTQPIRQITDVTDIVAAGYPAGPPVSTQDFTSATDPCPEGIEVGQCSKDCSELVPSSFAGLIANKPCNWLNNRRIAFSQKLQTLTYGSCQYKRVYCKYTMLAPHIEAGNCYP